MIVQPTCQQVAIFATDEFDVEIVQERAWNEGDETSIVIARRHAGLAARAILDAAGMQDVQFYRQKPGGLCWDYDPLEDIDVPESKPGNPESGLSGAAASFGSSGCGSGFPEPKDQTAAERQRRYRAKKRNGKTVTPDRNATVTEGRDVTLLAAE